VFKRNYWLIFVAIQVGGTLLALLGHSGKRLLYVGLILLLPGDLLASIFSGAMNPFLFYPMVVLMNAAVWFLVRKMLLREAVA